MKQNKITFIIFSIILLFSCADTRYHQYAPKEHIHYYKSYIDNESEIKNLENKIGNITHKEKYKHTIFSLDLLSIDSRKNNSLKKVPHLSNTQFKLRNLNSQTSEFKTIKLQYEKKLVQIGMDKREVITRLEKNSTARIKEIEIFVNNLYSRIKSHEIKGSNAVRISIGNLKKYLNIERQKINELNLDKKLEVLSKSLNVLENLPVGLPMENYRITSHYRMRRDPHTRRMIMHTGIDLAGRKYSIVYTTANGKVKSARRLSGGYGKAVIVEHANGSSTLYAHLDYISVSEGDQVKLGQKIGIQGDTGKSTNDHLHYETRLKNHPLNPVIFTNF